MTTIDDKVVAMSFESKKFEEGVHSSISALDKLKAALHFPGAGKGLEDINAAAKRMDLSHIAHGVEDITRKFGALSVAGLAVIASLATAAARAGISFAKSFTIDPIKAGFHEYATNLNAVQTILANTQAAGVGLKEVNATLDELNEFSDKTIYNFGQMARNIGTFTAAGVDLDTATASIKGIANLAALSGSNADQASTAMYQLSQAISAGRVGLQDWNSVVNAGMGGTVFQRALAQTAESMGTLKEGSLKLVGPMKNVSIEGESFRQSMQAGPGKTSWLTSKVLTTTLKQFTGDLSDAELKAIGFNEAQIKAIQLTAKTAMHAATEVKTIAQVFDVAKETAGSGWAQTFEIIFGDFEEAKKTFTSLSNTINGFINMNADARNKVLGDWKKLGGRTLLIEGIKNAFEALKQVIAPIKDAFRDFFPAKTGVDLIKLTQSFVNFTEKMKPSQKTVDNLRRIFGGLFAVFSIGKAIVLEMVRVFKGLFASTDAGSGGFLDFLAKIGDSLVWLRSWLIEGGRLHKFFNNLGSVLLVPIELFQRFKDVISDLFSGFSSEGVSDQVGGITDALSPLERIMNSISHAWGTFINSFEGSGFTIQGMLEGIGKAIAGIGTAIGNAASNMNFDAIFTVIRTGLFAGLVLMFKQFLGRGSFLQQISKGFGGGIIKNITGAFGALQGSMKSMQTSIQAKTLKDIAIAIGILALSVLALSFVDPERLKSSLTAITVMFGQLLGAMAILNKITLTGGFTKLPLIIGGMIGLAVAIDLLAIAVFALSKLSWDELVRGLTGVGALLGGIAIAVKPLSANSKGMITAGIGIIAIGIALNILALAMKQFATMKWQELAKGLVGVAGGLGAIVFAMTKMPTKLAMFSTGVGILLIAAALNVLAIAVEKMGAINIRVMAKGLIGIGGALVVIAGAMHLMPKGMVLQAAGLVLVGVALEKISDAVLKMGGMSIKQIAKGLITLALAMEILSAAMWSMSSPGTFAGAAALALVAVGIKLLIPSLEKLAAMSYRDLIKGIGALAAAFVVLGVTAALLAPAIPAMIGLGVALVLIGGALALAGAGIFLIGAGLSAIAIAGPAAVGILIAALKELEQGMVDLAKNLILGLLEIVDAFAKTAPKFFDAMLKILDALIDAIIKFMPKVGTAITAIITMILKVLHDNQRKIIQAGMDLIIALLQGIKNNLPQIVTLVVDIIVRFINALKANIRRIIDAGADLLVAFIKGIGQNIGDIVDSVVKIILKFVKGVADNLDDILNAGVDLFKKFLKGIAKRINDIADTVVDIVIAFVNHMFHLGWKFVDAGTDALIKFLEGLSENIIEFVDACGRIVLNFIEGLTAAVDKYEADIIKASMKLGWAIIKGAVEGLLFWAPKLLWPAITRIMKRAVYLAKHPWEIRSPSQVMFEVGVDVIGGFAGGMEKAAPKAYDAAKGVATGVVGTFTGVLKSDSPSKVMIEIGKSVGEGFAIGLKGSKDDIKDAFKEMNQTLTDAMTEAKETIASEKINLVAAIADAEAKGKVLNKLRAEAKPDPAAIKSALDDLKTSQATIREIQAVLVVNQDILQRTTDGHHALTETLQKEKKTLIGLANEYETITKNLEAARSKLEDLRQERKEIRESTTEQFGALPEFDTTSAKDIAAARKDISDAITEKTKLEAATERDEEAIANAQLAVNEAQNRMTELLKDKVLDKSGNQIDQLATYEQNLKAQTAAVVRYNTTLQKLRKMGLSDEQYKKLVEEGVGGQAFATELENGGRKAVIELNKIDANLQTASKTLGTNVSRQLKDEAIKIAFTAVTVLEGKEEENRKRFNTVGHNMMAGLKNALRDEKDPVGDLTAAIGTEMLARMRKVLGMKSPSREMMEIGELSMAGLAMGIDDNVPMVTDAVESAFSAMQKSISSFVTGGMDMNPVITPILDLTIVRSQSRELAALTTNTSSGQASIISAQQRGVQTETPDVALAGPSVQFQQNNYSPTALTEIEIYRQTKNQLSQLKSVLDIS